MELKEVEIIIEKLEKQKEDFIGKDDEMLKSINSNIQKLKKQAYRNLSAWDKVYLARHIDRPKAKDYIDALFDDFIELHGDRAYGDDGAVIGGLAYFHNIPVTVIAQEKGKTTEEKMKTNFGMSHPEGYRKALRLAKQAEKFKRPVITLIDTSGAYPGKGAEERGQAEAIARCLYEFSALNTIVLCVVIGEGGSGGALALSVGDCVIMLEHAVYSVLSPEGFAAILWKDGDRAKEASEMMKLTAQDLFKMGVVDEIIREPLGGAGAKPSSVFKTLDRVLFNKLSLLKKEKLSALLEKRYLKYRKIGEYK